MASHKRTLLGLSQTTSFPYPVLSPNRDDFPGSTFEMTIMLEVIEDKRVKDIHLTYDLTLECLDLQELLEQKTARTGCILHNRDTFRTCVFELDPGKEKSFPALSQNELFGSIIIQPVIWVAADINSWKPQHADPVFKIVEGFNIPKGSILGYGPRWKLNVGMPDKLSESIFELDMSQELKEGEVIVDVESDRIRITLAPETFDRVGILRCIGEKGQAILMAGLYQPVVMEVLDRMRGGEGFEQYMWHAAFSKRLNDLGLSLKGDTSLLEISQKLLQLPLIQLHRLTPEE